MTHRYRTALRVSFLVFVTSVAIPAGTAGQDPTATPTSLATESPRATAVATPGGDDGALPAGPRGVDDVSLGQPLFPWAGKEGGVAANWPEGLLLFGLGVIGALLTVYLFLGESLPSMGGRVEYEVSKTELRKLKELRGIALENREKLARGDPEPSAERLHAEETLVADYDRAIARLEGEIRNERWRLFALGFPLYIILGGFFAAAFALNLLQALLIGFGWTALADRIGIRRERDVREDLKQTELDKLDADYDALKRELTQAAAEKRAAEGKVKEQAAIIDKLIAFTGPQVGTTAPSMVAPSDQPVAPGDPPTETPSP